MKPKIIILSFLLFSLGCVHTGQPTSASIFETRADALMASQLKKKSHPGFAVLVSRGDKVLFSRAYGMAETKGKRANVPDTPFRIGSVTKQFIAAAILVLQERGKLSVQDSLAKYYPEWPNGKNITLHHLLTHTSGLYSYTSNPFFAVQVSKPANIATLIPAIQKAKVNFPPGEKWEYCNSGYLLLGLIIEKVSGKSYGEFLQTEFFNPLKMNRTGVHVTGKEPKGEALGYAKGLLGYKLSNNWDMTWAGGAGALYSTTGDLHRWNEGVFGGKVLKKESLRAAFTPVKLADGSTKNYGYGWGIREKRGVRIISHGGGLQGFQCSLARAPDQKVTVVVLCNAGPGYNPGGMTGSLADIFLEKDMTPVPVRTVNKKLIGKNYDDYVGSYDFGKAKLVVTHKSDQLFAKLGPQPRFEIYPLAPDKFFWKVVEATVKFERDKDGNISRLVLHQNGQIQKAPRLK
jgi:CubicO group peptidase (beta-lactamase class C family)|tara:strand:+ start:1006 stop:2385 length:1380 start_codon:yes stop_codon:yes gene_type:complete